MGHTAAAPSRTGPGWQRVVLVLLGLYGVFMALVTPAGALSIMVSTILFVLAVALSLSAPGNRRYKQFVLIGLAALLLLAVASLAWA